MTVKGVSMLQNRKIVELERAQKPLIEANRRLTDRNRSLQLELKKFEQKLCHSQDDYLSLVVQLQYNHTFQRDVYERLVKENTGLKEKRSFPEKLEEFERYRNQVLEYSKCITALRQSGIVGTFILPSQSVCRRRTDDMIDW